MPLPRRRQKGYESTMAPDEKKKTRRRGRSMGEKRTKNNLAAEGRRHSTGDLTMVRSSLRVKSQFESLKRKGLSASMNDGSGRKHTVEFAFLEVREFPIIL